MHCVIDATRMRDVPGGSCENTCAIRLRAQFAFQGGAWSRAWGASEGLAELPGPCIDPPGDACSWQGLSAAS
eukprot:6416995-Alexandrium_andersonii.AAC.1